MTGLDRMFATFWNALPDEVRDGKTFEQACAETPPDDNGIVFMRVAMAALVDTHIKQMVEQAYLDGVKDEINRQSSGTYTNSWDYAALTIAALIAGDGGAHDET